MWPMLDSTANPEPRKPAMVFALAGDSTITRGFGTSSALLRFGALGARSARQGARRAAPMSRQVGIMVPQRGETPHRDLRDDRAARHHLCRVLPDLLPSWRHPPVHRGAPRLPGEAQRGGDP